MPTNKPIKLKSKHRMIAEAFQKKQKKGRRVSLDFHTSHDDPLGMKFDMASVTSQDMSSAWMEAIPKLVTRRGGIALPVAGTLRRYSDSDISSMVASRRASIDSQLSEAEKAVRTKNKRKEGGERRSHRGLTRINPADIAAFNAKRRGSNLSQKDIDNMKAKLGRRLSNTSNISNATADQISLDCEELRSQYISSRRSSFDCPGVTPTAQLEQLTLATYSMFTANALLPNEITDSKDKPSHRPQSNKSSSTRSTSATRKRSAGKSRPTSSKMQTPHQGYVNGALDDEDLSDVDL